MTAAAWCSQMTQKQLSTWQGWKGIAKKFAPQREESLYDYFDLAWDLWNTEVRFWSGSNLLPTSEIFDFLGRALLLAKDSWTTPCLGGCTPSVPFSHSLPSRWNPRWGDLLQPSNLSTPKCVTPVLNTCERAKLRDTVIYSRGRRQKFCSIHFAQHGKLFDKLGLEAEQCCYQPAATKELGHSMSGAGCCESPPCWCYHWQALHPEL